MTNLSRLTMKKQEKTQIKKWKKKITIDTVELKNKRILWKIICLQIYNLEEVENFLETYSSPKLNKEINDLNRLITRNKIESVKKKNPMNWSPRLDGFIGECYFSISNSSKKLEKGTHPKTFYETTIILIPKPKTLTEKKIIGHYLW